MSTINAGTTLTTALSLTGNTDGTLDLATGGTIRMTINGSGNVGIGTASPTEKLSVSGSGNTTIRVATTDTSGIAVGRLRAVYTGGGGGTSSAVDLRAGDGYAYLIAENNVPMLFGTNNTERMRIDSSGNVGIGGAAGAERKLQLLGTLPSSGAVTIGTDITGTIPSSTTTLSISYRSVPSTQDAAFTLGNLYHFQAVQGTITGGSRTAPTNQIGFLADSTLTGATNNFGFFSNIASGTGRWNFYADGTARNYFAGNTGIGTVGGTTVRLWLKGSDATSTNFGIYVENSTPVITFFVRNDGLFRTGTAANSPYNYTTGSAANTFVNSDGDLQRSTSSLRYKTDITDATHGLVDVLKLRSVTYKGKNDGEKVFGGLIAEEVHDAGLTEFVAYDNEGRPDAIHYGNMVALLTKAIQEQQAMIDELKAKVAALETK
jgi:hypothetical protein